MCKFVGMAEKLFQQLESTNRRFEIKIITLDVISRLIGLHQLFLFSYYPYIQRFLQPHQREVTRVLQFAAQASHELVPPDVIEPILKTLANNFITERNSSDVMAIGLNAVREICSRCPLAMSEDLLRDLAMYKTYRDRSVMMAAKSLIHLFRNTRPEFLHKKDRGRPTEATQELVSLNYGQIDAKDYVPGAEVLLREDNEQVEVNSDSGSDDEEWIDIKHSSDEDGGSGEEDNGSDEVNSEDEEEEGGDVEEEENDESENNQEKRKILKAKRTKNDKASKKELAHKVTLDRILTDEDFKKIDTANIKKQVQGPKGAKRKIEEAPLTHTERPELVKLGDIENIYKKRKHDKQTRIETVRAGQVDREKFGYKDGRMNIHCSKTNREKRKNKNFQMLRHKMQSKGKRSFKDKQIALRNHLLKLKKMK
jgi:protein SDA1